MGWPLSPPGRRGDRAPPVLGVSPFPPGSRGTQPSVPVFTPPQGQPGLSPGHYPGPAAEPEMPLLGWDPPKPPSGKPCLFNKTEPAGPHRAPRIPSSPTPHTSSSKQSHFPGLCLSTYLYDFNASISRNGMTSCVRSLTKTTENMARQVSSFLVQKTQPQFLAFVILN